MILQLTPVEELLKIIDSSIEEKFIKLKQDLGAPNSEELMTRTQTSNFLQINLSTLFLWTQAGKLKMYGIGNRRYYLKSEVIAALKVVAVK